MYVREIFGRVSKIEFFLSRREFWDKKIQKKFLIFFIFQLWAKLFRNWAKKIVSLIVKFPGCNSIETFYWIFLINSIFSNWSSDFEPIFFGIWAKTSAGLSKLNSTCLGNCFVGIKDLKNNFMFGSLSEPEQNCSGHCLKIFWRKSKNCVLHDQVDFFRDIFWIFFQRNFKLSEIL